MEENKKLTSKEILPESERSLIKHYQDSVAEDLSSNIINRLILASIKALESTEAAEREVEEKDKIIEQMQLDDVYQQDDIRSKRADIEFLENKIKEKIDEFDTTATKLAYQLRAKDKIIDSYATAARVIHLHLKDYCNEDLSYDEMIADASRLAATEISSLKREIEELKSRITNTIPEFLYKSCEDLKTGVYGDEIVTNEWNNYVKSLLIS